MKTDQHENDAQINKIIYAYDTRLDFNMVLHLYLTLKWVQFQHKCDAVTHINQNSVCKLLKVWVSERATDRGCKLIKSLIVDCKYSMRDSCRRGCVLCLKQGWLFIIPGICYPSQAWSLLWSLPVTPSSSCVPTIYSFTDTVNLHSMLWPKKLSFFSLWRQSQM